MHVDFPMTASHVPSKDVRHDHEEDDDRRDPRPPFRPGAGSDATPEDLWLVMVVVYIIRAVIYSVGYMYHVGSQVMANIPCEFDVGARTSPAGFIAPAPAPDNVDNNANLEEPAELPFPVHMPTFEAGSEPDNHLGRRWYVVFVGRQVGVFSSWDKVAAATYGVSGQAQRRVNGFAMARRVFFDAAAQGNVRWVPDDPGPRKYQNPKRDDEGPGAAGGSGTGMAGGSGTGTAGGCVKREE
ncbi:hypothetical protein BD410DRAFT_809782 [Rickenella mellea]|uniref:Ribonuclease H1 N-terminal domain-containing protein n=1 Tax=Rickenella mellea TaxID=50990 RepID=A0A4Y7PIK1_9AGAM|nr:hypothetical protein BD410DRAFT_809782 [Rickenella mellea]